MIDNVEYFGSELYVEIFRDSFDMVVLEYREVETGYTRANQAVAASIPPEVEALWKGRRNGWKRRVARLNRWWKRIAVCAPKRWIGSGRDGEALSLDVVVRIARIGERIAAGPAEPARIRTTATPVGVGGAPPRAPSPAHRHTTPPPTSPPHLPPTLHPPPRP